MPPLRRTSGTHLRRRAAADASAILHRRSRLAFRRRRHGLTLHILVTNDDGIDSPGIVALVEALSRDHDVMVVAPSGDRSGMSHSITGNVAITLERRSGLSASAYACSGTPADCAFLGSTELGGRPDLVVSGINYGPNLADDINYSGTVAGAVEACLLGIPALAVSLACEYERPSGGPHWEAAAEIVRRCIQRGYDTFSDVRYYWNLNVPDVALDAIRGIAVTRLGRKRICGRMIGADSDGGASYYRAWESPFETDRETVGTDIGAVHAGYASLTPLVLDRTASSAPGGSETFAEL